MFTETEYIVPFLATRAFPDVGEGFSSYTEFDRPHLDTAIEFVREENFFRLHRERDSEPDNHGGDDRLRLTGRDERQFQRDREGCSRLAVLCQSVRETCGLCI